MTAFADGSTFADGSIFSDQLAAVSGDFSATEPVDSLAVNAVVVTPLTLAATEPADDSVISGAGIVSGTVNITEPVDSLDVISSVVTLVDLAATEPVDILDISGSVLISGDFVSTESPDTILIQGEGAAVSGNLDATEGTDAIVSTGEVIISGDFSADEPIDTILLDGEAVSVTGDLSVVEPIDNASIDGGGITVTVDLITTDEQDEVSIDGGPVISGNLSAEENIDELSSVGSPVVSGDLSVEEPQDTLLIQGAGAVITASLDATESADSIDVDSSVVSQFVFEVIDDPDSVFLQGTVDAFGDLVTTETTDDASIEIQVVKEPADVIAALVGWLKVHPVIGVMTEGRVYGEELPSGEITLQPTLVIRSAGGPSLSTGTFLNHDSVTIDVVAYAPTVFEAQRLRREVFNIIRKISRVVVNGVLIHWIDTGGAWVTQREPDVAWPSAIQSFQVYHALEKVA